MLQTQFVDSPLDTWQGAFGYCYAVDMPNITFVDCDAPPGADDYCRKPFVAREQGICCVTIAASCEPEVYSKPRRDPTLMRVPLNRCETDASVPSRVLRANVCADIASILWAVMIITGTGGTAFAEVYFSDSEQVVVLLFGQPSCTR
eukprot:4675806-Prymnesium_polylepis.2